MRILYVRDTDWIRRNPIHYHHLTERLVQKGHEIRVVDYEILWREEGKKELMSKNQNFYVSRIIDDAKIMVIRPRILKIPVLDYFSMLFTYGMEIYKQIKEFKPDIIIGNDILTTFIAFNLGKMRKIPILYYTIDIEHRLIPYSFLQPLGKIIERRNIKTANLVLSINDGLMDYSIKMGADPKKCKLLKAGIDLKKFNPNIDGSKIRKRYGLKKTDLVLCFMGWLYHFSGLKEVAKELSKIKDQNVKLYIIGDGDAYDDLVKIREKNNLKEKIILTGKVPYDELPQYLAAADICLLPCYDNEIMRDVVPIKFFDYLAMGKPVISRELPGVVREFGYNNGVTYIQRPEDTIKIAKRIYSKDLKEEKEKARSYVKDSDWENRTDEFEDILGELI